MKPTSTLSLTAVALALGAGVSPACSDAPTTSQAPSDFTEVDHAFRGKWAVDLRKVDQHYGQSSEYFLGIASEEVGLQPGLPPIWDQTAKREPSGELHQETGTEYGVIDWDGVPIDPVGYVNLIPMLPDTDPAEQTHIRSYLEDGDVIVYFHPEQTGTRAGMERRASHVGMHYEYRAQDGRELVHHIDNPNSYGPVYNHRPSRQMPFHVYRFKPRKSDVVGAPPASSVTETHEGVGYTAAQSRDALALVNQGDAATEDGRRALQTELDERIGLPSEAAAEVVDYRANNGAIANLEQLAAIPHVGPTALVALRDAVTSSGEPVTAELAAAYGRHARDWAMITNDLSPFASFFDLQLQRLGDLDRFAQAALGGQQMPELYCSGLAYANLSLALNFPLNERALGSELYQTLLDGSYTFSDADEQIPGSELVDRDELPRLGRLVFEPYGPSDILNAWIANYWASIPLPMQQQIFQSPEFQQQIVVGFSELEWSGDRSDEKQSSGQFEPATLENVARWARAYGRGPDQTDAYLAADPPLAQAFAALGLSSAGMTPMDVLRAVEDATIANKFVPPQIWMNEADRDDASLVYVGTVLNCELLTAVDGSGDDPCAGGGGGVGLFAEGSSDTSNYPEFAVKNGGERTHRRFDVVGPSAWGPESTVTVRVTHGDLSDVRFLLHVPAFWEGHESADLPYQEYRAWCTQSLANGGLCSAEGGIWLDPEQSGVADDRSITWRLGDVCTFGPDGQGATCPVASRSLVGGSPSGHPDYAYFDTVEVSTWADGGRVSVTMLDLGADSSAVLPSCETCPSGGGQYNQFKVTLQ
ncbi:MAG: helix-hairpin-helix domain-containing protein [Deltaproteobacteria bacterium]|nr:helix-hairpin-helix domain-containing protein [Deltaproteobacteria bacterium]MBW2533354.1 helix-hairpin-helix domain-containing protein [Deltaproteobacteria bacterium]